LNIFVQESASHGEDKRCPHIRLDRDDIRRIKVSFGFLNKNHQICPIDLILSTRDIERRILSRKDKIVPYIDISIARG